MTIYLDTSVVIPFFVADAFISPAKAFLQTHPIGLIVSDFVAAEFASAIARRVRMKDLTRREAQTALANFDAWILRAATRAETEAVDIRTAETALRRLDLPLRTPDALNIAIAQRLDADLATFDKKMAARAKALGVTIVSL